MVIEREVKCYYMCTTVVSGFMHLIAVAFGPVPCVFVHAAQSKGI